LSLPTPMPHHCPARSAHRVFSSIWECSLGLCFPSTTLLYSNSYVGWPPMLYHPIVTSYGQYTCEFEWVCGGLSVWDNEQLEAMFSILQVI
jgi:hypothetical protein